MPDGTAEPLWDLPWSTVVTMAKESSTTWTTLVGDPCGGTGRNMHVVYRTVCGLRGHKPVKRPSTRQMADLFQTVDDPDRTPAPTGELQWTITLPDGDVVKLWDVDWKTVANVAEAALMPWDALIDRPLVGTGEAATALYAAICEAHDQTPVEDLTVRGMVDLFDLIPDDKPTVWLDGLPAPKAGDPPTD